MFVPRIDDIIEDIVLFDSKFGKYCDLFETLSPPRNLYIDNKDIIIETDTTDVTKYSIDVITPKWESNDVKTYIFDYLDKIYNKYNK